MDVLEFTKQGHSCLEGEGNLCLIQLFISPVRNQGKQNIPAELFLTLIQEGAWAIFVCWERTGSVSSTYISFVGQQLCAAPCAGNVPSPFLLLLLLCSSTDPSVGRSWGGGRDTPCSPACGEYHLSSPQQPWLCVISCAADQFSCNRCLLPNAENCPRSLWRRNSCSG